MITVIKRDLLPRVCIHNSDFGALDFVGSFFGTLFQELLIRSAAFSAIIAIGACGFPPTILGMTEPSTTRSRLTPLTLKSGVTTELGSSEIKSNQLSKIRDFTVKFMVPLSYQFPMHEIESKSNLCSH